MQSPLLDAQPMSLMGLLITLRSLRVRLDVDADGLRVDAPVGGLTPALRQAVCQHKEVLKTLPRPFLRAESELIIPAFAAPQYHWQPLADTLHELSAPPKVWRLHSSQRRNNIEESHLIKQF